MLFLRRRLAHCVHSVTVAIHTDDLVWGCRDVLGGRVDLEHDGVQRVPLPYGRGGLVEEVVPKGADNRSAGEFRGQGHLFSRRRREVSDEKTLASFYHLYWQIGRGFERWVSFGPPKGRWFCAYF